MHDAAGSLVPESLRGWSGGRADPRAVDPDVVPVPEGAAALDGTWLYAGHWNGHFGHFLLETLPTLWPEPRAGLAGIVVHRPPRGPLTPDHADVAHREFRPAPWQQALLDAVGYGGLELCVVLGRPVRAQRLLVPGRPSVLKQWALPQAVDLWRRAEGGTPSNHERVWLSRSAFQRDGPARRARADAEWSARAERAFEAAGYVVVGPEELSIPDQIALVRGARSIAGLSGSALHLSVFGRPGTEVVVVGDARDAQRQAAAQRVIDEACAHRAVFVPHRDDVGLRAAIPRAT